MELHQVALTEDLSLAKMTHKISGLPYHLRTEDWVGGTGSLLPCLRTSQHLILPRRQESNAPDDALGQSGRGTEGMKSLIASGN